MPGIMPMEHKFQEHGNNVTNQCQYPQIKYDAHKVTIKHIRYIGSQPQNYHQDLNNIP